MRLGIFITVAALGLTLAVYSLHSPATLLGQSSAFATFEGSQTTPIRLSADATRLFAVNTPNGSLSVFDVSTPRVPVLVQEIRVGLEPVSVAPRTADEVWVVNQLSDSVSVVSLSRGIVVATLRVPDEPMDVVFAGGHAFVSVSRSNAVVVFDAATRRLTRVLPLFGGNPRALAVSPDGSRVYAAFALSGNATTIVARHFVPPPPAPTNPALPPAPQAARIVAATDPEWSWILQYEMPDNDVAVIGAGPSPTLLGYYSGVGTVNLGLAVSPVTGDLFVANTDARNLVTFEPNLRGHWVDNRVTRIDVSSGAVTAFDLNPDIDYSVLPNPAARATALAQPTAVVFEPAGRFMYVAAFGTDRVARVDTAGRVLSFVEVGPASGSGAKADPRNKRGPRGLALMPLGGALYVMNRISNTISVIDTRLNAVVREVGVGTDPTPPEILAGRGFLYDAKLSGNGTGSCASCHIDGDMDHLAWDLGNPGGEMTTVQQGANTWELHPMKGPMTTQTLRGLGGTGPLHWRGDKPTFLDFNGAFDGLMGGAPIPLSDMQAFATFVDALVYQPNPHQNLDRTLPTDLFGGNAVAGREVFLTVPESPDDLTCNACHKIDPGPGTDGLLVQLPQPEPMKTAHLRNIYQKTLYSKFLGKAIDGFGMDHEGHVASLPIFFSIPGFAGYTARQKADMTAFLMAFDTGTAPAVGFTVTLTAQNVDRAGAGDWSLLEQQARARNVDVSVSGTINGQVRTLSYRPFFNDYVVDGTAAAPLTRSSLEFLIRRGDVLTVMGVPPREGIAREPLLRSADIEAASLRPLTRRGH